MLKKNDLYEGIWQPVVNREKSHDRTERPDIKRDTCHELERRSSQRRSSDARQLGCVFQDMTPPKSILRKSSDIQEKEHESGRRLCEYWSTIFQARVEGSSTITLRPSCDTSRKLVTTRVGKSTETKLNELMATKKESAPGPDGISLYRCAGGLGSQFLFNAYKHVLEGGAIPVPLAESITVFPKSSDVDNNGRIVRSPEALRPLTLCNCDCKILTAAICRGLHWYTVR